MEALTLSGYLASLRFAEVATPEPGPNDVLVRVKAASVNPVQDRTRLRRASHVEVKPAPVKCDTVLLDQIGALATSKAVQPVATEVFAFADAPKAFEHVMTGHARAKVMLDMTP